MRQRKIARQGDRPLAEFFVLLLLLAQELLRLVKLVFGLLQFPANLVVGRFEFAVFCRKSLSPSSLRITTSKKISRRFEPRSLVSTD